VLVFDTKGEEMIAKILHFLAQIISKVLSDLLKTPAREEKAHVVEGEATRLDVREYDGLYGSTRVHDRREGAGPSPDGEPRTYP
jgi:hypothetical protein